jgi:magnesium chelatase subunit I
MKKTEKGDFKKQSLDLPATLGALKTAGYTVETVQQELRRNLIASLKTGVNHFELLVGYDDTVIPQIQRAVLAGHSMGLLGLRGQAKTMIARCMVNLLDEFVPIVKGSEMNDHPLQPVSYYAVHLIEEMGEETPVAWLHRSNRFGEKLATPDVTISDLLGDLDPIKAAINKLPYSHPEVLHFGIIPRYNRGIFVINELPDLPPGIQVGLFNVLQESDLQIRGFNFRLPLDMQFVFTANPEDYTQRGAIITPLKDRIQSQIITHYPKTIEDGIRITREQAKFSDDSLKKLNIPEIFNRLIEYIAYHARKSEMIDAKSGVSARLGITAMELLYGAVEQRKILSGSTKANARIYDLYAVVPAITGKVELVFEGEEAGLVGVAYKLIGNAIRSVFSEYFPDPVRIKALKGTDPYSEIVQWFTSNEISLASGLTDKEYHARLNKVAGLLTPIKEYIPRVTKDLEPLFMELVLFGLAEYSILSAVFNDDGAKFNDVMADLFDGENELDEDDEDDYYDDDDDDFDFDDFDSGDLPF